MPTPKVYLDRFEIFISHEARSRAVLQQRREEDAQKAAMRRATEGGPHPFVMASFRLITASVRQLQREKQESEVLRFLKGGKG